MKSLKWLLGLALTAGALFSAPEAMAGDPLSDCSPGRGHSLKAEHFFPTKQDNIQLGLAEANTPATKVTYAPFAAPSPSGTTVYGLAKSDGAFVMVSADINATTTLTKRTNMEAMKTYDAGVYAFGRFYTLANLMDRVYTWSSWDITTWNRNDIASIQKANNPMCISMTFNSANGTVYGCFINSSTSDYEFATFDVNTAAKTTISPLSRRMIAMAADNDGKIFAIGADGVLYSIDTTTGATVRVGDTGVEAGTDPQSACFDSDNGELYWFKGNTVYVVDRVTGVATAVTEITGSTVTSWVGVFIIPANIGSMPGWPGSLKTQFSGDSLSGILSFRMPSQDTAGNALTGSMEYTVMVDGENVATGEAAAGANVTVDLTLVTGNHQFTVFATNKGAKGMEVKTTRFIGHDSPSAPANLEVENLSDETVRLSWDAVTTSVNNGYIDTDKITYNVVRQPDNVVVASGLKTTSYVDATLNSMGYYTYEVTATDGTTVSEPLCSERLLLGITLGVLPPYTYLFDDPDGFGLFSSIDANSDGYKWALSENPRLLWLPTNPNEKSDDWLITPAMNIKKDFNYNLQIDLEGSSRGEYHLVEICYGSSPDPASMTHVVRSRAFVFYLRFNDWFKSEIDGPIYIGLHVVSPAEDGAVYIKRFSIGEGYASTVPAAVSLLKATAAPKGGLSADITFTAPTTDFSGATLSTISRIVVRNTTTGKDYEFTSVKPGQSVTMTDNIPAEGSNTYAVTCYNASGKSLTEEVTTWVGMDIPGRPSNVKWTFVNDTKVRLTWDAPTGGEHGGYVKLDEIHYYIVVPDFNQVISTNYTERSMDIDIPHAETQVALSFGVSAVNEKGIGVAVRSNLSAYGTPLPTPFYESFQNAGMHSTPWIVMQDEGYNSCNAITDIYGLPITSYDDDGMIAFTMFVKGSTRLELPLLDISKLVNPALKMWVYFVGGDARIKVRGNTNAGTNWIDLGEVKSDRGEKGWHLVSIPLSRLAGEKRLHLGIEMVVDEKPEYYYYVLIDKLSVIDNPQRDVMISAMTVPDRATAGETFPVTVDVTNSGWRKLDSFTVNCTVNDIPVLSQVCGALEPDEVTTVELDVPLSSNATSLELIVEATCDGDAIPQNNKWKATHTMVTRSRYPSPKALINTSTDEQVIKLKWTAPESRYQATVTDDMESYEHGTVGGIDVRLDSDTKTIKANVTEGRIGNYRLVDNDKMLTTSVILMVNQLPHEREGMVCQVIDLDRIPGITDASTIWCAHSESTMLCFWQSRTETDNYDLPNDDWLILPELADNDPRISLWAKSLTTTYGLEQFEIMVSMESDRIEDFVAYESVTNIPAGYNTSPNGGYTFYEFELPEGTRYVALRYNAAGSTALLVDDITYTPADNYRDLTLKGYNVYRNGLKINKELLSTPEFSDAPVFDGDYLYNVTSVFAEGESRYSNTVRVMNYKSGIENAMVDNRSVVVENREIIAKGFAGETIELYTMDGRMIRSVKATEYTRMTLAPGIYMFRVADFATSVMVK